MKYACTVEVYRIEMASYWLMFDTPTADTRTLEIGKHVCVLIDSHVPKMCGPATTLRKRHWRKCEVEVEGTLVRAKV